MTVGVVGYVGGETAVPRPSGAGSCGEMSRGQCAVLTNAQCTLSHFLTVSYCLIQSQWQGRMTLRQRWRPRRAGEGLGWRMVRRGPGGCWMGGAEWSGWSDLPRWRAGSAVRQNRTHP